MASSFSILLVDDHALLRAGLRLMLEQTFPGALIREASSVAGPLQEAQTPPSLVLLDIELPGLNGIDGIAVLKRHWPETPVVILTSHSASEVRADAIARGAAAFLSKAEPADQMMSTLQAVVRGEMVPEDSAPARAKGTARLTPRQCEVLDQLRRGYSNKVIGRNLNLSENTVRVHVQGVLAALGVATRAEAVNVAIAQGLVR